MDRFKSKIFNHQSGIMGAVKSDLEEILEGTLVIVAKVKSDPPPKGSLYPVDPGLYTVTSENGSNPSLIDKVNLPKG